MVEEKSAEEAPKKEEEPKEEAAFEELENLSRVVPGQVAFVKLKQDTRYVPIKKVIFVQLNVCLFINRCNRESLVVSCCWLIRNQKSHKS